MKKFTLTMTAAVLFLASGCGTDCESLCDEIVEQNCSSTTPIKINNCSEYCDSVDEINERAGCESQFDDSLSCSDDNFDALCADPNAGTCTSESAAYIDCFTAYCTPDPSQCVLRGLSI